MSGWLVHFTSFQSKSRLTNLLCLVPLLCHGSSNLRCKNVKAMKISSSWHLTALGGLFLCSNVWLYICFFCQRAVILGWLIAIGFALALQDHSATHLARTEKTWAAGPGNHEIWAHLNSLEVSGMQDAWKHPLVISCYRPFSCAFKRWSKCWVPSSIYLQTLKNWRSGTRARRDFKAFIGHWMHQKSWKWCDHISK